MSPAALALDEPRLRRLVSQISFVRHLEVRESTGSTNDDARRLSTEGAPSGTVVIANHQRSGKGRLGRVWHSAPGLGLYVSVLIRPSRPTAAPTRWTLASALAAWEACRDLGCADLVIEWPNDLYHEGRKVAGTLTEIRTVGSEVQEVIVGTGFNVNHGHGDFPRALETHATSLALASGGRATDRERLAARYVDRLGFRAALLEEGGWGEIVAEWIHRAPNAWGARVEVRAAPGTSSECFRGVTRGVDDSGALRVERDDGTIVPVHSNGSISLMEA